LREPGVDVRALFDADAHRVPPVIRSLDQATQSLVEVVLR
jgi:hypothetical protein